MLAVCAVLTAAMAAGKLVEDDPAGTATDAGTETAALLLLRTTVDPPLGAAYVNVTVHDTVPGPVIDWLTQVNV